MEKEKTLKIGKQILIIISAIVVILVGFLIWNNNNECNREQLKRWEFFFGYRKDENHENLEGVANEILMWVKKNPVCADKMIKKKGWEKEQFLIDMCIQDAWDKYKSEWLIVCEINNIPTYISEDGATNCTIPESQANEFARRLQIAKDGCITRYK